VNPHPKRPLSVLAAVATLLAPVCATLHAATPVPFVTGMSSPSKTLLTPEGNLLVAEAGTGPNTGRLSLVTLADGSRKTLVEGLPSALAAPNNQPSGPSGLTRQNRTVYLTISTGDAVVPGSVANTTIPNPRLSSPLFTSVLAIDFTQPPETITAPVSLTPADHAALKSGTRIARNNLTIELVADFPDYVAEPRPDAPDNVRAANPYGLVVLGERLFVVDASLNSIRTIDLATRAIGTLMNFAPLPNTRGMGPPVVEAVPDSIRIHGNQLLVTLLTGFPFPIGGAQARLVDPATGASTPFITGLTSAIDVLPLPGGSFLALEHSADMLAGAAAGPTGRLKWFATPTADPIVVSSTLNAPTRLELDDRTGSVFVTELFAGRILKLSPWGVASTIAPNIAGRFANLSVRGVVGTGADVLIAGIVVEATPKPVLVRGVGPSLAGFGVTGALADPRIVVYDNAGRVVVENDNWSATGGNDTALLSGTMARAGAFPLAAGSRDAAMLVTLPPGAYSIHLSGVGGATGIALVEAYQVP
jgi:hypothetical protein